MNPVLLSFALCLVSTLALVPKPVKQTTANDLYYFGDRIDFLHDYTHCYILHDAQKRLSSRLRTRLIPTSNTKTPSHTVSSISIMIENGCDESEHLMWPSAKMNEHYNLMVKDGKVYIAAEEIWGVLHAFESLAQVTRRNPFQAPVIDKQIIDDFPKYPHRGYLLDTSRHHFELKDIFEFVDLMAMTKMNVLHWYIVSDEAFSFNSYTFPNMSLAGSYDSEVYIYTRNDVKRVLEYCRLRGIRVIPEFGTPGHTTSWSKSVPAVMTECYEGGKPNGKLGPMDPSKEVTYNFMRDLIGEINEVFPENLLHLGGMDFKFDCWASNPGVQAFMKKMGFDKDYKKLRAHYFERVIGLLDLTSQHPSTPVLWEDMYDEQTSGLKNIVFQVWKPDHWNETMKRLTAAGVPVIFSANWYLSTIHYKVDWQLYYNIDPANFEGTAEQKALILGGEGVMWSDLVDETILVSRAWPRGAAVAERLWSSGTLSQNEFRPRLDMLRCEMLALGYNVEPANGPGYCSY